MVADENMSMADYSHMLTQIIANTLLAIQEGVKSANERGKIVFKLSSDDPVRFKIQVPSEIRKISSDMTTEFLIFNHETISSLPRLTVR
jgi:hypothetical protein